MGRLDPYIELLAEFVEQGGLDAGSFEERFFALFKGDATMFPDDEFLVLDRLFGDVDAFEPDPEVRGAGHLDEEGLRASAREALAKLRHLASRGGS
ncbi:MAG TPA: colicin immunity domain-containing protein [Longimicrobiaceae bacterium]|nr:colicin immunity domain-containing protein [Longimicrobiaceae bacterium]